MSAFRAIAFSSRLGCFPLFEHSGLSDDDAELPDYNFLSKDKSNCGGGSAAAKKKKSKSKTFGGGLKAEVLARLQAGAVDNECTICLDITVSVPSGGADVVSRNGIRA
jgi:hypothetical protein